MASALKSQPQFQDQAQYPRPLHPGGFSLPPLVEDFLPVAVQRSDQPVNGSNNNTPNNNILQTNLLLIRPPDPESLWEWLAYTKRQSESDPSWGRVWPTALTLARWIIRSLEDVKAEVDTLGSADGEGVEEGGDDGSANQTARRRKQLLEAAIHSLRTSSHIVELGCGLGVTGLTLASAVASSSVNHSSNDEQQQQKQHPRTITFLDREPYALHCCMSSASANGLVTAPIVQNQGGENAIAINNDGENVPMVVVRAAIDDWTLPRSIVDNDTAAAQIKNICYKDLHLDALPYTGHSGSSNNNNNDNQHYKNKNTIVIATDIIYESSSMNSLATKLLDLMHPVHGGYALLADPERERTSGCRNAFIKAVEDLGGEVDVMPMPLPAIDGGGSATTGMGMGYLGRLYPLVVESDVDIDGSLATTVLIVVRFPGNKSE